jgi:hypothetical protein
MMNAQFTVGQIFEYPETHTHKGAIITVESVDGDLITYRAVYWSDDDSNLTNLAAGGVSPSTSTIEAFAALLRMHEEARTNNTQNAPSLYGIYEGADGLEYELRPGDDIDEFFKRIGIK